METINFSDWQKSFESHIQKEGFAAAWSARSLEAAETGLKHIFSIKGNALLTLLKHDPVLAQHLEQLSNADKATLEKTLTNAKRPGCLPSLFTRLFKKRADHRVSLKRHSQIKEGDGSGVLYHNLTFQNWGRTVENTPSVTFVPKTKAGICNIVQWAKANNKRVRAAGYRHTWGNLYSEDNQVLISSLPLDDVNNLPAQEPAIDPNNELQGIEIVGTTSNGKALCKIGAGTTNEQFRRWCLDPKGGNLNWTIPLNVIMVEITWGGSNAPICHGAGSRHKTLSDLVTEVEFVNVKG